MPATDSEGGLRAHIRELLEQGRLPDAIPQKIWGGKGSGQPCVVCSLPILPESTEYEIDEPLGHSLRFHLHCFAGWQHECVKKSDKALA